MEIVAVGLDHRKAPMEVREKAAFTVRSLEAVTETLKKRGIAEVVVLSTCNRSEIYAAAEHADAAVEALKEYYVDYKTPEIAPYLYTFDGRDAVWHLFRVVAGLDSMILGEDQILGQSKDALADAEKIHGAGKFLTKAFREAITFSKKIKTVYKISETPLSLSSTAVKHVKRLFPEDYQDKKVLIIGSGKMGTLALQYMDAEGFNDVTMTNRTYHPPLDYQDTYHGEVKVVPYPDRYSVVSDMDVIISATASPHTVLKSEAFPALDKPLLLIDLALPRDIDPALAQVDGVTLLTIDDFNHIIDETKAYREKVAQKIAVAVEDAVDEMMAWLQKAKVDGMVAGLNRKAQGRADETIDILNKRYHFEGKDYDYLEKIVRSEFRKMVMPTIKKLKNLDDDASVKKAKKAYHWLIETEEN